MHLLGLETPPDGFNFDAWLEAGTDVAASRRKADEVLPPGHYIMHGENHIADPPDYNTHYMYLFGRRLRAWEDDLHGIHYLWFAVRGLHSHGVSPEWGQRIFKLMMWDSLVWGGASGFVDLPPAYYYDRWQTQEFVGLTRLLWRHGDLLGLVKDPAPLPQEDLLQDGLAVNVFDGSAPTYFPSADSPGGDKRLYAFKTGGAPVKFGDAAYYETMPPVPEESPRGDLFAVKYEPGYHFITSGINSTWRTPIRREQDRLVIRADGGGYDPGTGAVLSFSRESPAPLRELLLTHEAFHGVFFALPAYREACRETWEALDDDERAVWTAYFDLKGYNTADPYLVVNEFQSYVFQQERAAVPAFQAVTLQRVRDAYPALGPAVRRLQESRPDSFLASFDALDRALAAAGGPPGGRVMGVRRTAP